MERLTFDNIFKLIKEIVRWITLIMLIYFLWNKFISINFDILLQKINFSFNDLVSLFIAFFAIWISINFFHKNNETSNKFYDNTYNFTKNISETLGRIEERFGIKLDYLNQDNKNIYERIDKYYSNWNSEIDKKKDDAKKEELVKELDLKVKNKEELLETLVQKYNIEVEDKQNFINEIQKKDDEILKLNKKVSLFEWSNQENNVVLDEKYGIPSRMTWYFSKKARQDQGLKDIFCMDDTSETAKIFQNYIKKYHSLFVKDLEKYDLIDWNKFLTEKWYNILGNIIKDLSI